MDKIFTIFTNVSQSINAMCYIGTISAADGEEALQPFLVSYTQNNEESNKWSPYSTDREELFNLLRTADIGVGFRIPREAEVTMAHLETKNGGALIAFAAVCNDLLCASDEPNDESGEVMMQLSDIINRISVRRNGVMLEIGFNAQKVTAHCVASIPYESIESQVVRGWSSDAARVIGEVTKLSLQKQEKK